MLGRPRVRMMSMRHQIGEMTPIRTPSVSHLELRPAKSLKRRFQLHRTEKSFVA